MFLWSKKIREWRRLVGSRFTFYI